MVRRVVSSTESGRDWQLGRVLRKRSELEEQHRQCLIDQRRGQKGEANDASDTNDNCSAYKAELEKPIVLPAES